MKYNSKNKRAFKNALYVMSGWMILLFTGVFPLKAEKEPVIMHHSSETERFSETLSGFDSLNVRFVGNWPFGPSYVVSYDSSRNLVFAGSGGGVYILDVSDPSNPVKLSEKIHTWGIAYSLFYEYNTGRLYIADGTRGLEIWDVSNSSSPQKLGNYWTPGYAYGVYVSGNCAYVADWWTGFRIIDVSDPSSPSEMGFYKTANHAYGIYIYREIMSILLITKMVFRFMKIF